MTAFLAIAFLVAAILVGGRGFYVWNHCGYDCAALPVLGTSATFSMLLGLVLAGLGVALLLGLLLQRGK